MKRASVKLGLSLAAVLVAIAYAGMLVRQHAIRFDEEGMLVHAGDYYWRFDLTGFTIAQFIAGAGAFGVLTFPAILQNLRLPFGKWIGFAFAAMLWTMSWFTMVGLERTSWPMALLAGGGHFAAFYILWRMETPRQFAARMIFRANLRTRWKTVRAAALGFGAGMLLLVSGIIYHFQPRHVDAQSQVAQARILLSGHWYLPISQAVRDVIEFPNSTHTGNTYSQYPPGHIALLAIAMLVRLSPVFVDLIAGAFTLYVTLKLGSLVGGRRTGIIAAILLGTSPWFWVTNGGAMNQGTTVLELAGSTYLFVLAWQRRGQGHTQWLCCGAGLLLGWCFATRPLTAAAYIGAWSALWAAIMLRRSTARSVLWWPAWVFVGALPALIGFAVYNVHTTGHVLQLQYSVADPELHRLGFHQDQRINYPPSFALHHTFSALVSLNTILLGWPTGSLVILAAWWLRTRLRPLELLLLLLVGAQVLTYQFYHFAEVFMGPRFWYETIPYLAIFAAIPIARAARQLPREWWGVTALVWFVFVTANGITSARTWLVHFHPENEERVRRFLREHQPFSGPTAIVIPQALSDTVGWYITPGNDREPTLLFIKEAKEKEARALPELRDFHWISMLPAEKAISTYDSLQLVR